MTTGASDEKVIGLCKEIWQWRLQESPELATFCGYYQFDHLWDDISVDAYNKRAECVRSFLERAKLLDIKSCSKGVALSHALLVHDLELYLKGLVFKSLLMPINYLEGIHVDCNQTISFMKFDTENDFEKYILRLKALPIRVLQIIDILRQGIKDNIVPFSCSMQRVPDQIDAMVKTSTLDELDLMLPFRKDHPSIPKDKMTSFQREAKDVMISDIFPAFEKLKNFLNEEYSKAWRPKEGINSLKDGDAWYQQCLNFHLSCIMTPEEVHNIGLKEVARIRLSILQLAQKEDLGQTFPEIWAALTKRQKGYFKSKDEVLTFVKDLCYKKIRPKISQLFKDLPDIEMKIEPAPPYMKDAPAGYYLNGTPDGSRDGTFRVNIHKLDECFPFEYPALCLHEGEPGHHLQGIYSLAATHLPEFRRYSEDSKYYLSPMKFSFNTAYVEGWGLYSEALGEELGVYENNLDMLGRYAFEIFRACRLVVDTGLHAFGWSKDKALEFMLGNCLSPPGELKNEVERYITWPGQACAYKIGEMKIWELRRKAEKKLGSAFDIREFHHCILDCGAVPLDVLASVVDQFILETTKAGS
ncbi:hypothetical protein EGW08_023097 [Elysia chlorotica]|uniref:DUF885 domain-containing protein n=1 Tax=Elysia chlorotica TaxID=188477 RepID=A0A3S1AWI2_ELYCH|nr:hypothetical protein EGW08_023097 [Elysia chlorotica]